ncbi:hypothetical protein VQ045_19370, partial [Aurantimonas sp. E1-2-R+4]|uniref:hypothetical protein n=1 Tax=Aurantimonas sp. E1-2-R+4 TaxID=3113714 RepID=UPI002F949052
PRFAFVHIASMPSSNQINSMESQTIHIIQLLCGPTLRPRTVAHEAAVLAFSPMTERAAPPRISAGPIISSSC